MSMDLSTQIAISATAAVAFIALPSVIQLLRKREAPAGMEFVASVPAGALLGAIIFDALHEGGLPRTARLVRDGALIILCIFGLAVSVRMLIANWRNEEALADWYGSSEGYIPRPPIVPVRIKAVLYVLFFTGFVTVLVFVFFHSLLAPA